MNTYLALKSLHILGVVLFVGNIIVTGWWKVQADRTRNPAVIAFAQRQVTLTDWIFTFGGSTLVVVGAYATSTCTTSRSTRPGWSGGRRCSSFPACSGWRS